MKTVFVLAGPDYALAAAEVKAIVPATHMVQYERILLAETKSFLEKKNFIRFACVLQANVLLFSCSHKELVNKIKAFKWSKVYKTDFCVRIKNFSGKTIHYTEKELADIIWDKLKNPKTNLSNPATSIEFILTRKYCYATIVKYKKHENFKLRNAHMRPAFYPGSLDARIARLCVNLTGIQRGKIFDPFCGSGTILIEAGLIGLRVEGSDINSDAVRSTIENLKFFKIKNYNVKKLDATKLSKKYDYFATQLPFGIAIKIRDKSLYQDFIFALKKKLGKRAVVIFPHFFNYKKIIQKANLHMAAEYGVAVNGNLTRKIVIIEPRAK